MIRRPCQISLAGVHRAASRAARATVAALALLPGTAFADALALPTLPPNLEAPGGHVLFRLEHAVGTQNYVCIADGDEMRWAFFGPQATLFSRGGRQTATHFLAVNPDEDGELRPVWQDSRDTSAVWARPIEQSSDPAYVAPDAIPWLLLHVEGESSGPKRGRRIAKATYVQRVNTSGGKAPATGCSEPEHLGAKELVPYEADYAFYRPRRGGPMD